MTKINSTINLHLSKTTPSEPFTKKLVEANAGRLDAFALNVFVIYVLILIFESPIRYGLNLVGLVGLIYIRDLLLVLVLFTYIVRKLINGEIPKEFFCISIVLIFHFFIALHFTSNLSQALFGLKIWIPFIFGLVVASTVAPKLGKLRYVLLVAWILLCVSIFINSAVRFPWEGLSYDIGGVKIEGNKEWTAGKGIKRIAGTTRSSIEAAILLLVLMSFFLSFFKSNLFKTFLFVVTLIAVIITTTKSAILSFLMVFFYYMLFLRKGEYKVSARVVQASIYLILIGLPIYPLFFEVHDVYLNYVQKLLFNSFMDRMQDTWPLAFKLVMEKGNVFLGRGVGGIGMPQQHFGEMYNFNPADNLFMYLYVTFGFFSLVYLGTFVFLILNQSKKLADDTRFLILIVTGITGIGFAMNIIENATCSIFLGMAFAHFAQQLNINKSINNLSPIHSSRLTQSYWHHGQNIKKI